MATSTAWQYAVRAHHRADVGQRVVGVGRIEQRLVERTGAVGGQLVEARDGVVVAAVELVVAEAGLDEHVLDERGPLAPVVVGGELADHRHHRVGVALVVGRDVGQVLDLAHDVVAEVAHDPAVQRRQVVERAAPSTPSSRCSMAARIPWSSGTPGGQRAGRLDLAAARGEGGERVAADEAPAAPPLAVLDRLEQEAVVVADQPGEGRHGRGEVGQHLAPHGDHGVVAGQGPELLAAGAERHPKAR